MPVVLYRRQRQVLDFLVQYIQKNGHSPTLREIADALGLSAVSTVHEHVTALEEKGVIERNKDGKPGFEIINQELAALHRAVQLPILGYFADRQPIEEIEKEQKVEIPQTMIDGEERAYILQVKDNSLREQGVVKDDFILLEEEREVDDGQVAIIILEEGQAVMRKFYQEATRIRLGPLVEGGEQQFVFDVQLQGKVTGILRNY